MNNYSDNKLFIICPECCIESAIRSNFQGNIFFFTTLGALFQSTDSSLIQSVKTLISQEDITEIYILHDTSCAFLESEVLGKKGHKTQAEKQFRTVLFDNIKNIDLSADLNELCVEVAKYSLINERDRFIRDFRPDLSLSIKLLLYNRTTNEFHYHQ